MTMITAFFLQLIRRYGEIMGDVLLIVPSVPIDNYEELENVRGQILNQGYLGVGYIASSLERNGIACDIIDMKSQWIHFDDMIRRIHEQDYQLIGFSVVGQLLFKSTITIIERFRQHKIDTHITLGGHFPSFAAVDILERYTSINSVIKGEGEGACIQLYKAIRKEISYNDVSALTYRDENNSIIVNPVTLSEAELDELPFPKRVNLNDIATSGNRVSVIASRGCAYQCSFCTVEHFYKHKIRRMRSPLNVVQEIECLYHSQGIVKFSFSDDIFMDRSKKSRQWIEDFTEQVKKRNLKIDFLISLKASDVEEDLLIRLKEVGLTQVFLGLEFANEFTFSRYKTGTTLKENEQAIQLIRKLGLELAVGFIFFEPYMTWDELKNNFYWLKTKELFYSDHFFNELRPYTGTPIREQLIEDGLIEILDEMDCGQIYFRDKKVTEFYNILIQFKLIYLEVNSLILGVMFKEKSNRAYTSNEMGNNVVDNKAHLSYLYRSEAELWLKTVEKLIGIFEEDTDIDPKVKILFETVMCEVEKLKAKVAEVNSRL